MSDTYDAAIEIREVIVSQFPDAKERRRYALLQAAATVYGSAGTYRLDGKWIRVCTVASAVGEAEELLAEIEKRETGESQS